MASFLDILNGFVSGLIPGDEAVTGLGSIYFFLIFLLIFSVTFTATAYIPMFSKNKDEYKNIRLVIAVSMAFVTSISSYAFITEQIQIFGLIAAIALGLSLGIISVVPKKSREKYATKITLFSILVALVISLTVLQGTGWVDWLINFFVSSYTSLLNSGMLYWTIIIIIVAVSFIYYIVKAMKDQSGGPPAKPGP